MTTTSPSPSGPEDGIAEVIPIRGEVTVPVARLGTVRAALRKAGTWFARKPAAQRPGPGRHRPLGDAGMSTAEYAIGTVAAAAFAAVLYTVLTGDSVVNALTSLVQRALSVSL